MLKIRISIEMSNGPNFECVEATASLLSGKDIGSIRVPKSTFNGDLEIRGEFILLSSKAERCTSETGELPDETKHSAGREELKYNIMLIEWDDDYEVAYRVSWTKIDRITWEQCNIRKKRIIL
ncbi:hypothetical protein F5884DRAFT_760417, partial [Xylogone sp. PMI_703]